MVSPLVLIAACLTLAGTALKIQQWYFSRPLWLDEEMVLLNVRDRSFGELTGALWLSQAAPIGWLWLQRVAVLAFGTDDRVSARCRCLRASERCGPLGGSLDGR